jgi:hypothetical protein
VIKIYLKRKINSSSLGLLGNPIFKGAKSWVIFIHFAGIFFECSHTNLLAFAYCWRLHIALPHLVEALPEDPVSLAEQVRLLLCNIAFAYFKY